MSADAGAIVMNVPAQQAFACAENHANLPFWCEGVPRVGAADGDAVAKRGPWEFVQHLPSTPLVVTGRPNLETIRPNLETTARNRKKLLESQR